jgi:dihydrofolate reductase
MNAAAKVVVTHRGVDAGEWANSSRIPGPLATWVHDASQTQDIVVIGSGSIVAQLQAAGLVDEYRLLTFSTAVGAGRRLYPDGVQLRLAAAERVGPATLATYSTGDSAAV